MTDIARYDENNCKFKPRFMINVQANHIEICELLHDNGHILFDDKRHVLRTPVELRHNVFALHRTEAPELLMRRWA
jgi:hypothetical protein